MSRNYKFHNPERVYFVSFAVVEWLDVFTRNEYKHPMVQVFKTWTSLAFYARPPAAA